jgi:hypothetical protein
MHVNVLRSYNILQNCIVELEMRKKMIEEQLQYYVFLSYIQFYGASNTYNILKKMLLK